MNTINRALISVSDKRGIVDFARQLSALGVEIVSTGGSAKLLQNESIAVIEVSEMTGFPEMMDGRLKTLHPKVHGGILGRRGIDDDVMAQHGIGAIDLVCVNLYPFQQTVAKPDCTLENAIENIDIGGPTMVRAAAKNHRSVSVVVDADDYPLILQQIRDSGGISDNTRFQLAVKAFQHTAAYDGAIANYLGSIQQDGSKSAFPSRVSLQFKHKLPMRYGENPHQQAAFYVEENNPNGNVSSARQVQGKELSYNNIADTDAALECVKQFDQNACVIVKHANPCGVALANNLIEAYNGAYATDPTSAFGGIIAFNRKLDCATASAIVERQFVEVIIAPELEPGVEDIVAKKPNVRLLVCGAFNSSSQTGWDFKRVVGGLLVQDRDNGMVEVGKLKVVTQRKPSEQELRDLLFSWKVAKFVKSNAIVYAKDCKTIGVGAGQMSRVYSARIAAIKAADANLQVKGAVMASDAFFPFRDGIDSAAEVGISAVIQPGGSMRDDEVIKAADEHGIAMVFTGMRHFKH